jgi:hypothetical protein
LRCRDSVVPETANLVTLWQRDALETPRAREAELGLLMPHRFGLTLAAFALTAAGLLPYTCAAQIRLSYDPGGLGLRQQPTAPSDTSSRNRGPSLDTLDTAFAPESPLAPRQYTLAGDLRAPVGDRKALSVGVKYRVYNVAPGTPGDADPSSGYALVPYRSASAGYAPGYQVRFGYQMSEFTRFGLALSREPEAYAAAFDPASPYPIQVTFTGQHWLTPSWGLSYDVLTGDLGGPNPLRFQGLGLRLGVRYRFY